MYVTVSENNSTSYALCATSVSGASHYIECVTPTGTHRQPPAYTHTAKKVSQPSAMLRNSQAASSRREIPEITCFIVLFLFCKLSLASLLSPVGTQWWCLRWNSQHHSLKNVLDLSSLDHQAHLIILSVLIILIALINFIIVIKLIKLMNLIILIILIILIMLQSYGNYTNLVRRKISQKYLSIQTEAMYLNV